LCPAPSSTPSTSLAPTPTGTHWVACGMVDQCDEPDQLVLDTEEHEVRCCSDIPIPGWFDAKRENLPRNWAEAFCPYEIYKQTRFDGMCYVKKTYEEAKEICCSHGGRLCTKQEVQDNCIAYSGCNFNQELIWTSTTIWGEDGSIPVESQCGPDAPDFCEICSSHTCDADAPTASPSLAPSPLSYQSRVSFTVNPATDNYNLVGGEVVQDAVEGPVLGNIVKGGDNKVVVLLYSDSSTNPSVSNFVDVSHMNFYGKWNMIFHISSTRPTEYVRHYPRFDVHLLDNSIDKKYQIVVYPIDTESLETYVTNTADQSVTIGPNNALLTIHFTGQDWQLASIDFVPGV